MTSGRVRRRAALALAFGAALTTGAATGAWGGAGVSGPRTAESRPRPPHVPTAEAAGSAALDGITLSPDAARDLLAVLDDRWAAYYPSTAPDEDRADGTYPGVGLTVRLADGAVRVSSIVADSPAAGAGLVAGDLLAAVDGTPATELGIAGVVSSLRGPAGTPVTLTIVRDGAPRPVTLIREVLTGADVFVEPLDTPNAPGLTRVRVAGFGRGTADQVRAALVRDPAGVLLDLRGNPGGRIDEAAAVASAFLPPGPVVTYDDGTGASRDLGVAGAGDQTTPVVILVDGASASAAEVVTAALRDRGRAVVVGSTTYGKGSVQAVTALADGGALELTIGRWYPPSGRSVEGRGIDPDIPVPADAAPEEVETRAAEVLAGLVRAQTAG